MTVFSPFPPHEAGNLYSIFCNDESVDQDGNYDIILDHPVAREKIGLSQEWLRGMGGYFFMLGNVMTYKNLERSPHHDVSQLYSFMKKHALCLKMRPSSPSFPTKWFAVGFQAKERKNVILPHSDTYERDMAVDIFIQLVFEDTVNQKTYHAILYADVDEKMKQINDTQLQSLANSSLDDLIDNFKAHATL